MPDSPEAIRVEHDGPAVTVTLCRPERRNALDGSVVAELRDALRPLAEDSELDDLAAIPAPAQAITKRALVALGGTDLGLAWADPELHTWAATEPSVLDAVGRAR